LQAGFAMSHEIWIVRVYRVLSSLHKKVKYFRYDRSITNSEEELINTFYFLSKEEAINFRDSFMKEAAMRGKQQYWRVYYAALSEFKPHPSFIKNTFDWAYGKFDPIKELVSSTNKTKDKSNV
jgi:hypothetical protein